MELKNRIRELRLQANLTQEELAEKLFVNRSLISKWENGSRLPGVEDLKRISSLFGISLDELISGDKYPKDPVVKTVFTVEKKKRTEIVLLSLIIAVISARIIIDIFATYLELDSFTAIILHFFQETVWDILIVVFSFRCIAHEERTYKASFSMIVMSLSLTGKIISLFIAYICLYFDFGDFGNSLIGFILYSSPSMLLLYVIYRYCRDRSISVIFFLKIGLLIYIAFYIGRVFLWGAAFTAHLAFYLSRSLPEIIVSVICLYEMHNCFEHFQDME